MVPLASIAVIVAALYLAKGLIIPMTLAVLLSFLLSPVCDYLERRRLGRIPAVLVTALLGFTVLVVAAWAATRQMSHLATNLPEYSRNIELRLEKVNAQAVSALSGLNRSAGEADGNVVQPDPEPADRANGASQAEESPASMRIISALAGSACGGGDEVTFLDYDSLPQSATVWANQLSRLIVPMRPELLRAIAAIRDQASESIDEPADNNGNHRSESGLTSRNKAIIVPVIEIARRLRVTRCVVQKWTLEESFPKRADASEKSVFRWSEVVTWRIEHGNRRGSTE